METGKSFTSTTIVDEHNTAMALGSGNLPVFATPAMIALMEHAAMSAVATDLPAGCTTVGVQLDVVHTKASKIGTAIYATATLTAVEGERRLIFDVVATDGVSCIGKGTHTRCIVDEKRFMDKLK